MRKFQLILVALLSIVFLGGVESFAACPPKKKCKPRKDVRGASDISGQLRRMEEESEDLVRKMRNADPNTKRGLHLFQQRDELSLKIVHECQNYLNKHSDRNDSRTRKIRLMLKSESASLLATVGKIKKFPYPEALTDYNQVLYDIQRGRIKYFKRVPKNRSVLLKEIQEIQRHALEDYYKAAKRRR